MFVSIIVGIIVSGVAQNFNYCGSKFFSITFFNPSFSLKINLFGFDLNLIPLIICVPASILVGFLLYISKLPRWFGPADTIYAAHNKAGQLNLKGGFTSTLASLISISGGHQ